MCGRSISDNGMQTSCRERLCILPASMGHTCFSLEANSSSKWLVCKLVQRAEKWCFQDSSKASPICVLVSLLIVQKDSDQMQCNHTFWSLLHWGCSQTAHVLKHRPNWALHWIRSHCTYHWLQHEPQQLRKIQCTRNKQHLLHHCSPLVFSHTEI